MLSAINQKPKQRACALMLAGFLGSGLLPAVAQTPARPFLPSMDEPLSALKEEVAATDKAIFLDLVKLSKFNIHFNLEANHHQRWRTLGYALGRESGTALSFTGTLIDLQQQVRGMDRLSNISRPALKNATRCGIIGNAISGGASALELTQNTWVMLKARKHGYSPSSSLAFVKEIVADTDRLIAKREQLTTQEELLERRRIIESETKLIRRIRQQLLYEFGIWSCHSRNQAWRENIFYTLDSAQAFTRMGAGITALRAFEEPLLIRNAAVTALVANSVLTLNPIISNLAGVAIRKYQHHKIASQIPFERPPTSAPELDKLQQELSLPGSTDWLTRVTALSNSSGTIDAELSRERREIERYREIAQQQAVAGPLIGLTGLASSTLATVAVYDYFRKPRVGIRLGFAGRISQGSGQAFALFYTPYTVLKGYFKDRKLSQRGELPEQILRRRLARLEAY